ncbi:hypothetical protein [Halogeometricum limi]|uniref:Major facilitator superfamily (MFS) profile domain-containing protein n=1 Tax=Halogeometricum limi TaxID=555875 RepID=A0A1I6H884_9EURY|nr:hypothetical protein [Halogeometricum limi]SFR50689.1 hypothetical protein SAMN04488124_1908 [Halogeometricum limi]
MVSIIDFVVELLVSVLELVVTFVGDVFLGVDPLTAVSFLFGAAFVTVSSLVFGYLVLGAALNGLTGMGSSAPDASRRRRA